MTTTPTPKNQALSTPNLHVLREVAYAESVGEPLCDSFVGMPRYDRIDRLVKAGYVETLDLPALCDECDPEQEFIVTDAGLRLLADGETAMWLQIIISDSTGAVTTTAVRVAPFTPPADDEPDTVQGYKDYMVLLQTPPDDAPAPSLPEALFPPLARYLSMTWEELNTAYDKLLGILIDERPDISDGELNQRLDIIATRTQIIEMKRDLAEAENKSYDLYLMALAEDGETPQPQPVATPADAATLTAKLSDPQKKALMMFGYGPGTRGWQRPTNSAWVWSDKRGNVERITDKTVQALVRYGLATISDRRNDSVYVEITSQGRAALKGGNSNG